MLAEIRVSGISEGLVARASLNAGRVGERVLEEIERIVIGLHEQLEVLTGRGVVDGHGRAIVIDTSLLRVLLPVGGQT